MALGSRTLHYQNSRASSPGLLCSLGWAASPHLGLASPRYLPVSMWLPQVGPGLTGLLGQVWGEGVSLARKRVPQTLQKELIHFYTNPGCVTLLLNPKGQVMSEYQVRHSVTEASKSFNDHTDVSIDCYPLPEADREKPSEGPGHRRLHRYSRVRKKTKVPGPPRDLEGPLRSHGGRSPNPIPSMNIGKITKQQEVKETVTYRESLHGAIVPLPSIPEQAQLPIIGKKMQDKFIPRANQFLQPRICRKFVDMDCPIVALSVQKTAESRFGLKHLSYPPITKELREPL